MHEERYKYCITGNGRCLSGPRYDITVRTSEEKGGDGDGGGGGNVIFMTLGRHIACR